MAREEDGGKVAMGCVLVLIMIPVGILLKGFVLCQLWGWFVVPFGIMMISQAHAYGLTIVASLFITHGVKSSAEDSEGMGKTVLKAFGSLIMFPLFIWLVGYICHQFM